MSLMFTHDSHIRQEVKDLVKRGNITLVEYLNFKGNSWEQEAIVPALDEEAFSHYTKYTLYNCSPKKGNPASTYDDAVVLVLVPELLRRLEVAKAAVNQGKRTAAQEMPKRSELSGAEEEARIARIRQVTELKRLLEEGQFPGKEAHNIMNASDLLDRIIAENDFTND